MTKYIIIHLNDGGTVHFKSLGFVAKKAFDSYESILYAWMEAYKDELHICIRDLDGEFHCINSHKIIDIYTEKIDQDEDEMLQAEEDDLQLDSLDQTDE